MEVTTVESESLDRHLESHSVGPLIEEAIQSLDVLLETPSIRVSVDPAVQTLPPVMVDPAMLKDVFKNVVENGVKFNDKKDKQITMGGGVADGYITIWIEVGTQQ